MRQIRIQSQLYQALESLYEISLQQLTFCAFHADGNRLVFTNNWRPVETRRGCCSLRQKHAEDRPDLPQPNLDSRRCRSLRHVAAPARFATFRNNKLSAEVCHNILHWPVHASIALRASPSTTPYRLYSGRIENHDMHAPANTCKAKSMIADNGQ